MFELCNSVLQSRHHWTGNTPLQLWYSVFPSLSASIHLWKSHLLSATSPPLLLQFSLCYSEASCYQMLTAASWPMVLFFIQRLCSYRRFSVLHQRTIKPQLDFFLLTRYDTVMCAAAGWSTKNLWPCMYKGNFITLLSTCSLCAWVLVFSPSFFKLLSYFPL